MLYPDGTLQDAGGIVWSDSKPWNYGRGLAPDLPEVSYTRQADYLSGASILVDRSTWQQVGGFSEEFAPAYYEDTDLAFKVRKAGKRTVYAPLSAVIHHEGVSSGTDSGSGTKRYQAMNAPLFKAKWAHAIGEQPRPGLDPRLAADHRGIRGRALFLTGVVPTADPCDEGYDTIQAMRLLQSLGLHLTQFSERSARDPNDVVRLQRMGVEVAGTPVVGGLAGLLELRGPELDVVYLHGVETTDLCLGLVHKMAPGATTVLRTASSRAAVGKAGGPLVRSDQRVDVLLSSFEPDGETDRADSAVSLAECCRCTHRGRHGSVGPPTVGEERRRLFGLCRRFRQIDELWSTSAPRCCRLSGNDHSIKFRSASTCTPPFRTRWCAGSRRTTSRSMGLSSIMPRPSLPIESWPHPWVPASRSEPGSPMHSATESLRSCRQQC